MNQVAYRIPARPDLPHPLGRHLNHDARSRLFPYRAEPRELVSVKHVRHIDVLDQGNLGSCTGNAGIGCLGTGAFFATVTPLDEYHVLNEADAVALYSAATRIDPWGGTYPPEDTGSDGLSIAKVLKANGMIAGYEHAFGLDQALQALMDRPVITGVNWYDQMFNPTDEGLVRIGGSVAGGHEFVVDGYDQIRGWVWGTNSWGPWAVNGRFAMEAETWGKLLDQQGDVTVFTPTTEPAPQPVPDADHVFAESLKKWMKHPRLFGSARLKAAGNEWLKAKGL